MPKKKKATKKKSVKRRATKKRKATKKKAMPMYRTDAQLKQAEDYLGDATKTIPLPQSFFVTSILGFIIAATLMAYGTLTETWGFAFCLVFVMMFIASFVSIHPKKQYHD
jgi:Flp pilus assembly protein TadB